MTKTITPDALKGAAKRIRGLETERFGKSLPNTTILNALTQAFDLGLTFSGFSSAAAQAPAPKTGKLRGVAKDAPSEYVVGEPVTAKAIVVLRAPEGMLAGEGSIFRPEQQRLIREALPKSNAVLPSSWDIGFSDATNGLQVIRLSNTIPQSQGYCLGAAHGVAQDVIRTIQEKMPDLEARFPVIDAMVAARPQSDVPEQLNVSYSVAGGYSGEAWVDRDLWESAMKGDFTEAEALLVLESDQEIEANIEPINIVIDGIETEPRPYESRKIAPSGARAPTGVRHKHGVIIFEVPVDDCAPGRPAILKEYRESIEDDLLPGWKLHFHDAAHGFQVVEITKKLGEGLRQNYTDCLNVLIQLRELIEHHDPDFAEWASFRLHHSWVSDDSKPPLAIKFRDGQWDEPTIAHVDHAAWEAIAPRMPIEDALLILAKDHEVSVLRTSKDICVHHAVKE